MMQTALDAPVDALDKSEQSFVSKVRDHGWFRTGVLGAGEDPGYSFTTGFWVSAYCPELIVFSMQDDIAHDMFWGLFRDAKSSKQLAVGERTSSVFANLPAYAFNVAKKHYRSFLGWSRWFYGGDDFPCLQIVWPDHSGRFPWEPEFNSVFSALQPDLTERGWLSEIAD